MHISSIKTVQRSKDMCKRFSSTI